MGRLVRIPREASRTLDPSAAGLQDSARGTAGEFGPSVSIDQDDYLLRLAKYVPAEVLGFSILINAILDQALRDRGDGAMMAGLPVTTIAIAVLILETLMAPVYVWYVRQKGDAWVMNACVSFVAFPVWSYAIGAVAFADYRDGNLAAMLLASFTLVSGLIKPRLFEARTQKIARIETRAASGAGSAAVAARRLAEVISLPMPGP